jgi:hypothetical protein
LAELEPGVAGLGTSAQTLAALLAEVGGKDVAAAGEGTWRKQEDAAVQSAGTGACVVGNAKMTVVVEDGGVDGQL